MKRAFIAATFLVIAASVAVAAGKSARGTTAVGSLKLASGSRAIGMGEAVIAVVDDASAVYWNPAALTIIPTLSATVSHVPYIEDSKYDNVALGWNMKRKGALGLSAQTFSIGTSKRTDVNGDSLGQINPKDTIIGAGYGTMVDNMDKLGFLNGFSLGVGFKYISSTIVNTAKTVSVDVGALSKAYLNNQLRFALTTTNLTGKMAYNNEDELLPRNISIGCAYKVSKRLVGSLNIIMPNDNSTFYAMGAEYQRGIGKNMIGALRGGINTRSQGDTKGANGYSVGLGLQIKRYQIDYAYRILGNGWTQQGMSVSMKWGSNRRLPAKIQKLVNEGEHLLSKNKYPEAILKFNELFKLEPNNPEALEGIRKATKKMQ